MMKRMLTLFVVVSAVGIALPRQAVASDSFSGRITNYSATSVSVRGPGALKGSSGAYRDRLRKVDGAWLFTERRVVVDH